METNSWIINKIVSIFSLINKYYEYSFIYKITSGIGKLASISKIVDSVKNGIAVPTKRDYLKGSVILLLLVWIVNFIFLTCKNIYLFFTKINKKSLNKKAFDNHITILKEPVNLTTAISSMLCGLFLFFSIYNMAINYNFNYMIICIVLTMVFFITAFFINEEITNAIRNSVPFKVIKGFFTL